MDNRSWDIPFQLERFCLESRLDYRLLDGQEKNLLQQQVFLKYTHNATGYPLFGSLKGVLNGIEQEDNWKWMKEFFCKKSAILFFNPRDYNGFIFFENGEQIPSFCDFLPPLEYYITDSGSNYLFAYSEEADFMTVVGEASNWLSRRQEYQMWLHNKS